MSTNEPSPLDGQSDLDPGDDVQLRFRYQHGYGVVLLIASVCAHKDYKAIWCEHHEDFLAETNDGRFDAFQLKTRDTGAHWKISDEGFYKSIKRFVSLDNCAPASIREFSFVSNEKAYETAEVKNLHLCPLRLLAAVSDLAAGDRLQGHDETSLKLLAEKTGYDVDALFSVLKRTKFIKSFALDGFESLIAHEHLPQFEPCAQYAPSLLARIVERLIAVVCKASSLSNTEPERHYAPLATGQKIPSVIASKRVTADVVAIIVAELASAPFRYADGLSALQPSSNESWKILRRKLEEGGIEDFYDYLHSNAISAEANLLSLDLNDDFVNQIASLVANQCDEIRLKYNDETGPCGTKILRETVERFNQLTENHPVKALRQPPEMLVGVAGLLAGDCRVWWSKSFDLTEPRT